MDIKQTLTPYYTPNLSATPPSNLNTLFFLSKPFVLLLNPSQILSLPKQFHQFSIPSISKPFFSF